MLAAAALIMTVILANDAPAPITLPVDQWTIKTQGEWRARVDHRDLLAMRHPWTPGKKGDFASASRNISIPADWAGPVYLHFYCSDNYHTDSWKPDGSWLSAEGFVEHRFKQVIVNDRVVWTTDVADPVVKGVSPSFSVQLPVKPGETFLLTLLATDQVDSETVLPRDYYQYPNNEKTRDADPDHANFQTDVYWGDVSISSGESFEYAASRPVCAKVDDVHKARWPVPPTAGEVTEPVRLQISAPGGIPKQGFPLRQGLPFPPARITNADTPQLKKIDGKSIQVQREVLATWMDESVQWTLCDFPLYPGMDALQLSFTGGGKARVPRPVDIGETDTKVPGDPIAYTASKGACLANVACNGADWIKSVELSIQTGGEIHAGTVETIEAEAQGPFRTTLVLKGKYESCGSFSLAISIYRGLPYLTLWHRFINDAGKDIPISSLQVKVTLADSQAEFKTSGGPASGDCALTQLSEKSRQLNAGPVDADAPAWLAWKNGAITVRNFRELYPKKLTGHGDSIVIDLVAADTAPVVYTPGEAQSHEIWLAAGDVDPAAFAAAVANPPIMQNAEYFCATGVIGPAAPHDGLPVLHDHMANDFGKKRWEDFGQQFGLRDFPDSPYYGGLPKWSNNYYERMLGLWSEWWMSGDRAWFDRAFDVCRHIGDVAVVHADVPGKDWRGAIHGPGVNHVEGPWNPNLRVAGLDLYYKLTGDPDARQAVINAADFCVRTKAGIDGATVRDQAGPFDTICTAYALTADINLLDVGMAYVQSTMRSLDFRRGTWPDEHGSKVYRGNVPWMLAQQARPLYMWYRLTGDTQAAQALVALAESMICENTDWDKPGEMSGYSHNPHYAVTPVYDLMLVPVIYAAYELTQDKFFLDAADAQWNRWTREKKFDSPLNCHWNTPWLTWYLKAKDFGSL